MTVAQCLKKTKQSVELCGAYARSKSRALRITPMEG